MSGFEQYTTYVPISTTTTTWGGWQLINPRCHGCVHSTMRLGKLVCYCPNRTVKHGVDGDECTSYLGRDVR